METIKLGTLPWEPVSVDQLVHVIPVKMEPMNIDYPPIELKEMPIEWVDPNKQNSICFKAEHLERDANGNTVVVPNVMP